MTKHEIQQLAQKHKAAGRGAKFVKINLESFSKELADKFRLNISHSDKSTGEWDNRAEFPKETGHD